MPGPEFSETASTRGASTAATRSFLGWDIYRLRAPVAQRLLRLLPGLVLFGVALAFAIAASLGTNPWTVFAEGASERLGVTIGQMIFLISVVLVFCTRFFGEAFGLGTVLNAVVIGPVVDITLRILPDTDALAPRLLLLFLAPILLGLASGLYIGAGLGPGPRDSLMTALIRRGIPAWKGRMGIEVSVLVIGWLLGGAVGLGTIWMALSIGPFVQLFLPGLTLDSIE